MYSLEFCYLRGARDMQLQAVARADCATGLTKVCYENYSKFIRATELNNQVKVAMGGSALAGLRS
eukprot:6459191-Amphidinium_carterae.1